MQSEKWNQMVPTMGSHAEADAAPGRLKATANVGVISNSFLERKEPLPPS